MRSYRQRRKCSSGFGRNSAQKDIPAHVTAWAYLLKEFDNFTISQEKAAVKITRYNRVPDHLQGTGIALIKCDTAFLPGSIGAGASKEDLKNAQAWQISCVEKLVTARTKLHHPPRLKFALLHNVQRE